jgi:hypothetical protein
MNTKQKITYIVLVAIVLLATLFVFIHKNTQSPSGQSSFDAKNSNFVIDSRTITLVNGVSIVPSVPNSASMNTTRYFGNEDTDDLNGDGLSDSAYLVTENTGGSGLFYYAVVALQTSTGYVTTNAVYIGDRIAPQSTEIHSDTKELYINYADRKKDEPMTAKTTIGTTLILKVTSSGVLSEPVKTDIDAYVRANISALSPVKETVGGKFFVTNFEAHGSTGTVEYEDGHNGYTADFTYTTNDLGNLSITHFTVRQ